MTDFARSLAIVIGIDRYHDGIPRLQTAVHDAEVIAARLRDQHAYELCLVLDEEATLDRLTTLLTQELPAQLGPDDRVFFYFAGHGVALDGEDGPEGFLLPQDARRDSAASYLRMPDLHRALCALPCRHLLAVLDCCFAGAFRWSSMRDVVHLPSVIHRERYDRFIRDPAWQVITSAAHDQRALDVLTGKPIGERGGDGQHSPFAKALLDGLSGAGDVMPAGGGDGVITATELYLYLDDCLARATLDRNEWQTPCLWPLKKHDKGQFIFLTPGRQLDLPPAPELSTANNPYRGLQSFEEEHRDLFFGRERVIQALESHAAERALTVVVGSSGTGKSSLVKAGLVPALRDQGFAVLPVVRPGASPLKSLAAALGQVGGVARESGLWHQLQTEPEALAGRLSASDPDHAETKLLLVIDQLEELVTMCRDESEREQFLRLLARAVEAGGSRFKIVLTIRSDFEPQFAGGALGPTWQAARFHIPPMTQDELRDAIEKPAAERVLYFEPPELVDDLINEVVQTPGALPLLSFTLSEMYIRYLQRRADDRALTRGDYETLGGVVGALRHRATEEFAKLDPAHQASMRRVMLRMVSLEGGEIARRRVPRSELVYSDEPENARVQAVIDRLTAVRLLVEGREFEGEPYVEPAHDELVRGWDKLWDWIRAERRRQDDLLFQRRLTQGAREWDDVEQESARAGLLWQDPSRSAILEQVLRARDSWLNRLEGAFARQSIKRRRRNRRVLVTFVAGIAVAGSAAVVAALIAAKANTLAQTRASEAVAAQDTAEQRRREAVAARDTAEQRRREALASRDSADAQRRRAEEERRTAVSRELSARVDRYLREGRFDFAMLVGVEATNTARTYEARNALLTALQQGPAGLLHPPGGDRGEATALALSPDGGTVATLHQGEKICTSEWSKPMKVGDVELESTLDSTCVHRTMALLWEANSGKWSSRRLGGEPLEARSVAFSPDGKLLALGGDSVALYDLSKGLRARGALEGDSGGVASLVFSTDGHTLTATRGGGAVVRWDVRSGRRLSEPIATSGDSVWSLSGDTLAAVIGPSDKRAVARWDLSTGRQLGSYQLHQEGRPLALAPGGATLALEDSLGSVVLLDVPRGLEIGRPLSDAPEPLRLSADDARTKWSRGVIARFSPDGGTFALAYIEGSITAQGTIVLWDMSRSEQIGRALPGHVGGVDAMAFSQDGQTLAASGQAVTVWNIGLRRQVTRVLAPVLEGGTSVAFSPDGQTLASGDSGQITFWKVESGHKIGELDTGLRSWVLGLQYSPDGRILRVGDAEGMVTQWEVASRRSLGKPVKVEHDASMLKFTPDGRMVLSADDEEVAVWDLRAGRQLLERTPGAFSSDGRVLLSDIGDEGEVQLWNLATRHRARLTPAGRFGSVYGVALSPDGNTLAGFLRDDASIQIRYLNRGIEEASLVGSLPGMDERSRMVFSPDGKTLATSGATGLGAWGMIQDVITLWDVDSHQRLGVPLSGGIGTVLDLVWSRDGRRLASAGFWGDLGRGGIALWEASVESWQVLACRAANRNLTPEEWKLVLPGIKYHRICPDLPAIDYTRRPD